MGAPLYKPQNAAQRIPAPASGPSLGPNQAGMPRVTSTISPSPKLSFTCLYSISDTSTNRLMGSKGRAGVVLGGWLLSELWRLQSEKAKQLFVAEPGDHLVVFQLTKYVLKELSLPAQDLIYALLDGATGIQ